MKKNQLAFAFLITLLVSIIACNKDENDPEPEPEPTKI